MPTKLIASRIAAYKKALASGEIQKTYQSVVGMVQSDPDFDNLERLSESIRQAFVDRSREIIDTLKMYP